MKITALVENTSESDLKPVHGLSFYIETEKHKILFDLGPNDTIFRNAEKKNIELSEVDTVIISHGHSDHGGALKHFLKINRKARIYLQRSAYDPHYSKALFLKVYVGLDTKTKSDPNIVLLDGDFKIDDELSLFVSKVKNELVSDANKALFSKDGPDDFRHEQNLLIHENKDVLFMGCGHSGVISILKSLGETRPDVCIGGFHVYNPISKKTVPEYQLSALADALQDYGDVEFYTCHCTGTKAYDYLSSRLRNLKYFSCGEELRI